MAYVVDADVQEVLKESFLGTYPDTDAEIEFAEVTIDGFLAGVYDLKFDDVAKYASVPLQIKWIAAYLVAYKIWDSQVPLEGQRDDTAAQRWWDLAMAWLEKVRDGTVRLILADGTLVDLPTGTDAIRFFPGGAKEKADQADNLPYFKRAQAREW